MKDPMMNAPLQSRLPDRPQLHDRLVRAQVDAETNLALWPELQGEVMAGISKAWAVIDGMPDAPTPEEEAERQRAEEQLLAWLAQVEELTRQAGKIDRFTAIGHDSAIFREGLNETLRHREKAQEEFDQMHEQARNRATLMDMLAETREQADALLDRIADTRDGADPDTTGRTRS